MTSFWSLWITFITLGTIAFVTVILFACRSKDDKETSETTGHVYDGIEEYDNPLPGWWFMLFIGSVFAALVYLEVLRQILGKPLAGQCGLFHLSPILPIYALLRQPERGGPSAASPKRGPVLGRHGHRARPGHRILRLAVAVLLILAKEIRAQYQVVHLGSHETTVSILRVANDRLAPDVKTGVDDKPAPCEFFKGSD